MKKVLFLITCMSIGGAEKVLIDIVNSLDESKYNITVMLVYKNSIYDKEIYKFEDYFNKNIKVKYMCDNESKFKYKNFNRVLNRINNKYVHKLFIGNKYDVEIAFSEGLPTKIISSSTNKNSKKVAWLHTDSINRTKGQSEREIKKERIIYSKFTNVVAVSNAVAKSFEKLHNGLGYVQVNYNPINVEKISIQAKENVDFKFSQYLNLISIGRLTEVKGYERLINVMYKLKKEGFKYQLLIVGDGELRERLVNLVDKYNLNDMVILIGFNSNPYKYLSRSDLLICSSFVEGLSTVVLEAITLNKPVITTKCNGMDEIFGENNCGIICENSEKGLYDSIKKVILNPQLLEQYSIGCKQRASEFEISKIRRKVENLIDLN